MAKQLKDRKAELSKQLKELKGKFPHTEQMIWAVKNGISDYTVKAYLNGSVGNIPTAEKLLNDINTYLKKSTIN